MLELDAPLVVIAIHSPTDFRDFPQVLGYIALYGPTDGQVEALINKLSGEWHPTGTNPLTDFPLDETH